MKIRSKLRGGTVTSSTWREAPGHTLYTWLLSRTWYSSLYTLLSPLQDTELIAVIMCHQWLLWTLNKQLVNIGLAKDNKRLLWELCQLLSLLSTHHPHLSAPSLAAPVVPKLKNNNSERAVMPLWNKARGGRQERDFQEQEYRRSAIQYVIILYLAELSLYQFTLLCSS